MNKVTVQQMNSTVNNKNTNSSFNLMTKSTTKNTTLGIFLAVVMLCGSVPLGYSEPLRVQLEQGIETNDIQCDNPNHVLVQRNNGKLACVTERNAERMNWEIIYNDVIIPADNETVELEANNEKQILQDNNNKLHFESSPDSTGQQSHSSYGYNLKPIFTVDMPTEITVGETVSIDYTVSWVDENGDPLYNNESGRFDDYTIQSNLFLPDEIQVVSNDMKLLGASGSPSNSHMRGNYYGENIPYDTTKIFTGTIEIKLLEPMFYDHDDIIFGFSTTKLLLFQTVSTDEGIVIVTQTDPRSDGFTYHDGINGRYESTFYVFDEERLLWYYGDKESILETKDNGFPDKYVYVPEPKGQFSPSIESNYVPRQGWEDLAEFLRDVESSGQAEVTKEWLMSYDGGSMSEEFVDDFFEVYPEFLIIDTDFRLFFLPEAQAVALKTFYVYGYY